MQIRYYMRVPGYFVREDMVRWTIGKNDGGAICIVRENGDFRVRVNMEDHEWIILHRRELIDALNSIPEIIDQLVDMHIESKIKESENDE